MKEQCFTLEELATRIGAVVEGDCQYRVNGVADLERAVSTDISFFANVRYHQQMLDSKAGAIIVTPASGRPANRHYLLHEDPNAAFQDVLAAFRGVEAPLTCFTGVHPTAVVHPTACLGKDVTVCPYAVIDAEVRVGDRTLIGSFAYIGPQSRIGTDCILHPHVVVREGSVLGNRVVIQPGAILGSCGYGYLTDGNGHHTKLDQLGNVVLGDDVEIGANTTVDRARFQSTVIQEGTKIDNLVQIAHNVEIGKHALIVAQVGIAGSTKLGDGVVLGGQVAVNGHIHIGNGVRVTACSGVSKSLLTPGDYGGVPVQPLADYNRNAVYLRRIGELFLRVKALEGLAVVSRESSSITSP
jgi:UDP-3-O-[3-hydroxymyristoyl] glucosamine N-acyltransferase